MTQVTMSITMFRSSQFWKNQRHLGWHQVQVYRGWSRPLERTRLFNRKFNLGQNILGLTGLRRQGSSNTLHAIYFHVLRSTVLLPTWFCFLETSKLKLLTTKLWNLQRKFDLLIIGPLTFKKFPGPCFPGPCSCKEYELQTLMSRSQMRTFLMTTFVWPTYIPNQPYYVWQNIVTCSHNPMYPIYK